MTVQQNEEQQPHLGQVVMIYDDQSGYENNGSLGNVSKVYQFLPPNNSSCSK